MSNVIGIVLGIICGVVIGASAVGLVACCIVSGECSQQEKKREDKRVHIDKK